MLLSVSFQLFCCCNPLRSVSGRLRGVPDLTLFSKLWNRNFSFDTYSLSLIYNKYRHTTCKYTDETWAWLNQLWHITGLKYSNRNVFESFEDLYGLFTFTHPRSHLLDISDLVFKKKAQVSQYTVCTLMWYMSILFPSVKNYFMNMVFGMWLCNYTMPCMSSKFTPSL